MSCEIVPSTQSVNESRSAETLEIGKHKKSKPRTTTIEDGERQKTFKNKNTILSLQPPFLLPFSHSLTPSNDHVIVLVKMESSVLLDVP